ncbi:hypothetical protein ElyMa_006823000 [Elysia marginata]|uniref:Uncharacterized protein n=1 Tax=Elysia marginata TaxID=1093978 RepID=A0AAV4JA58_9GAST|nr:hypothetical protein ElyMa_006823000 [Elysia marginata]
MYAAKPPQPASSPPSPPPRKIHKMLFSFGSAVVAKRSSTPSSQRVVPATDSNGGETGAQPHRPRPAAPEQARRRWSPQTTLLSQIRGGGNRRRFSMDALPTLPSGIRPVRDLWQRYVEYKFYLSIVDCVSRRTDVLVSHYVWRLGLMVDARLSDREVWGSSPTFLLLALVLEEHPIISSERSCQYAGVMRFYSCSSVSSERKLVDNDLSGNPRIALRAC